MNQSETMFVLLSSGTGSMEDDDFTEYLVRSFTPFKEESFCGHGIAAAAILLCQSAGPTMGRAVRFQTIGGIRVGAYKPVVDHVSPDVAFGKTYTVKMEFPAQRVEEWFNEDIQLRQQLARCLGLETVQILTLGRNALKDLVIELSDDVDFSAANMKIDEVALMKASPSGRGARSSRAKETGTGSTLSSACLHMGVRVG